MVKNKPTIICEAIPFGFGPAAILKSIVDKMLDAFEIIIVTSGSTYDYFSQLDYNCILCSSYNKDEMKSTLKSIDKIDWVLSVENERIIEVAQSLKIRTAYVNVFEFIWSLEEKYLLESDLYIIYNVFETQHQIAFAAKKSNSIFFLQPELPQSNNLIEKEGVLIHLGGLNSNCISNEHQFIYSDIIIESLKDVINNNQKVKLVSNHLLRDYLSLKYKKFYNNIEFVTLNSIEFADALNSSKYYFTTPGIYSTLQGFYARTITHLLLPANYTQIFQLNGFNRLSLIKYPTFEDLFDTNEFNLPINEKEGLKAILQKLNKMRLDKQVMNGYIVQLKNVTNELQYQDRLNDQNNFLHKIQPNTHKLIELIKEKCII